MKIKLFRIQTCNAIFFFYLLEERVGTIPGASGSSSANALAAVIFGEDDDCLG
jgi:hypothetical protein